MRYTAIFEAQINDMGPSVEEFANNLQRHRSMDIAFMQKRSTKISRWVRFARWIASG